MVQLKGRVFLKELIKVTLGFKHMIIVPVTQSRLPPIHCSLLVELIPCLTECVGGTRCVVVSTNLRCLLWYRRLCVQVPGLVWLGKSIKPSSQLYLLSAKLSCVSLDNVKILQHFAANMLYGTFVRFFFVTFYSIGDSSVHTIFNYCRKLWHFKNNVII